MMKKVLVVILLAVMIGGGFAYYLFNKVVVKAEESDTVLASAFQVGVFTNPDNAKRVADRHNGIIITEGNLHRVYVAILVDKEAINTLKKYYQEIGLNYYLKEISVSREFSKAIRDDEILIRNSKGETYSTINSDILRIYKEM